MSDALITELRELLAKATPGPWELQDGCSWRRIGTRGHDGNVLCPDTYSATDRHPDLRAGKGEDIYANLHLIVAMRNNLEPLLEALASRDETVRRLTEALERIVEATKYTNGYANDANKIARQALVLMESPDGLVELAERCEKEALNKIEYALKSPKGYNITATLERRAVLEWLSIASLLRARAGRE